MGAGENTAEATEENLLSNGEAEQQPTCAVEIDGGDMRIEVQVETPAKQGDKKK